MRPKYASKKIRRAIELPAGCAFETLESRHLLTATLVQDFTPADGSSNPSPYAVADSLGYFVISKSVAGTTNYFLYRTDGTDAGTTTLQTNTKSLTNLTASGSLAYFEVQASPKQIWRTDGTTAGTVQVASFASTAATAGQFTDVAGTMFFVVTGSTTELWSSGGTAETTAAIGDPARFSSISNLTSVGDTLYFDASLKTSPNDIELWKSDGTDAGTVRVKDIFPGGSPSWPSLLSNVNGKLFFTADGGVNGHGLWLSDGTEAGTRLVISYTDLGVDSITGTIVGIGDRAYFTAHLNSTTQLFMTDGSAAGTSKVADINPGGDPSPSNLTSYNGALYFSAQTTASGRELWKSDGTAAGTSMVTDIAAGSSSSTPGNLTVSGGRLYFSAYDALNGPRIWSTDGTPAGTIRLDSGPPDNGSGVPFNFAAFPGAADGPRLLFSNSDLMRGREPWITDGTVSGTVLIANLGTTPVDSPLSIFVPVGNQVYFNGPNGLWVTDGIGAHSRFLAAPAIDATGFVSVSGINIDEREKGLPTHAVIGNILYYRGGGNLWRSDGTASGTFQVSTAPTNLSCLAVMGNLLYFSAEDGVSGHELWRSDGTAAGTYRVVDLNPGPNSTLPSNLTPVNGTLFFSNRSTTLRKSDGTAAGTTTVLQLPSGNDTLYEFQEIQNLLYFTTNTDVWRSDGTAAGTIALTSGQNLYVAQSSPLCQLGSFIYFLAASPTGSGVPGLWKTDGSTVGATLVKAIGTKVDSKFQPGYNLTIAGGKLYFTGPGGANLWVSDGTPGGTTTLTTVPAAELTPVGDKLYFTSGGALWTTDGTPAGTGAVTNNPAPSLTNVTNLTAVDGALIFSAFHPAYGNEMWIVNSDVAIPAAPTGLTASAVSGSQIHLTWNDNSTTESGFQLQRSADATFATGTLTVNLPPDRTTYDDRPLLGNTIYYYRLVAYSRTGDSPAITANATTPAGVPATPAALTASVYSDHSVTLNWNDNAAGETGYVLQRAIVPNFSWVESTFTLPSNTTSFEDTGTLPLVRYYYRVYATGAAGNSDYASIQVSTPDRAPAQLEAAGVSPNRIDLQWVDPSMTTSLFRIERASSVSGVFTQIGTSPAASTGYADQGLTPLSTWVYRVVAVSRSGTSHSLSVQASTTPPVLTTPVIDVPPGTDHSAGSFPSKLVMSNGIGYFVLNNKELWRTDGTDGNTVRVTTLGFINNLTDVNGTLFFRASDVSGHDGLFKSDGTAAGTVLIKDIHPGGNAFLHDFVAFNNKLYFRGVPLGTDSDSLWTSDGTPAGTVEVQRFGWRNGGDIYRQMIVAGGKLWLGANDPTGDNLPMVYVSDGTSAGTYQIAPLTGAAPSQAVLFVAVGNLTYFVAYSDQSPLQVWWRSDGTPAGTFTIANAPIQQQSFARGIGDTLYLSGFGTDIGWELFKVGPTDSSASLVSDLTPGAASSSPHSILPFGPGLAFFTTDGASVSLYVSGGTDASTTFIQQFPNVAGSTITDSYVFGGKLYFFVNEAQNTWELFSCDQVSHAVTLLKRFYASNQPTGFAPLGDALTFSANDGVNGMELWQTDGTSAGTGLVKDIANAPFYSKPDSMVTFNGAIYFTYTPMNGSGLGPIYRTDGTPQGTSVVYGGQASGLFVAGDHIYFSAYEETTGIELWITDGTTQGTHRVADVIPGAIGANPVPLGWLGDKLLFGVPSGDATNYDLWRTDGTAAGTVKLFSHLVNAGASGFDTTPVVLNGILYFTGYQNGGVGNNLWRSDGTIQGTYQVKIIDPSRSPQVSSFAVFNNSVYFVASDATHQWALWKSDGTSEGTVLVSDYVDDGGSLPFAHLTAAGGLLYFGSASGTWRSDGTAQGTFLLSASAFLPTNFTAVGNTVYFFAVGFLWKSDGTPAGTTRVHGVDLSNNVQYLRDVGGVLFYADGNTLWKTDGTFAGTYQVITLANDLSPQLKVPYNGALSAVLGNMLVFGAMTPSGGREVRVAYSQPPSAPAALQIAPAPSPAPPAGISPAPVPTGVNLTWTDDSSTESGFVIERSTTSDFATVSATVVPANTTTYTDFTASIGDDFFYRVRTFNASGQSPSSNTVTSGPPSVLASEFKFALPSPTITLAFSSNVNPSLAASDLHLRNLSTGLDLPTSELTLEYNQANNTASIRLSNGSFPDGRYRLTIAAADVSSNTGLQLDGNHDGIAGGDFTFDFFQLAGDANRDAKVDFSDLVSVAQHYGQSTQTWTTGDFNGDGLVSFADLVVVAQNYGKTLPVAAATGLGAAPIPNSPVNSPATIEVAASSTRGIAEKSRPAAAAVQPAFISKPAAGPTILAIGGGISSKASSMALVPFVPLVPLVPVRKSSVFNVQKRIADDVWSR